MKTLMSSISISCAASRTRGCGASRRTTGPAPTPAKDLTRSGPFPLSALPSARLLRVTTPPGSSADRGKTLCPQQLARPRTTRDHQQGNGRTSIGRGPRYRHQCRSPVRPRRPWPVPGPPGRTSTAGSHAPQASAGTSLASAWSSTFPGLPTFHHT